MTRPGKSWNRGSRRSWNLNRQVNPGGMRGMFGMFGRGGRGGPGARVARRAKRRGPFGQEPETA